MSGPPPADLFRDVKFYAVGDLDPQVLQLLRVGKAKEVSYNALASHIISEDGDNPEVGEAREVFDLPVVKPSWVLLSAQCGSLLPAGGFSPEPCQVFFGVTACISQVSPEDRSTLWAMVTFHGGACELSLSKKCTHLVVPEPRGDKYACAARSTGVRIVTPDWVLDCVSAKARRDEGPYHPRLVLYEDEDEDDEDDDDEAAGREDQESPRDGSSAKSSASSSRAGSPAGRATLSPRPPGQAQELMFDDSSDSSPEKQDRNLNWTPAEVAPLPTAKRRPPTAKEPGLINLCANVPPVPGGLLPPEVRSGLPGAPERPETVTAWSPSVRTLRNITNNADIPQMGRPASVAHILQSLSAPAKAGDQPLSHSQPGHAPPGAPLFNPSKGAPDPHPALHLPPPQMAPLQPFLPPQAPPHPFPPLQQPPFPPQPLPFPPQPLHRPPHGLPLHPQHPQHPQHGLPHPQQLQRLHPQHPHLGPPTAPHLGPPAPALPPQPPQPLYGHDPAADIPDDGFLLGCVFAVADYPEQMSDKQLLATWKRIIQAHGGAVDPTFSSRCTHLLCESQVSGMYAQALRERKRCVTAHWLNTVLKKKRMVPPHRALHFPVAFPPGGKPCAQHIISVTGFVDSDRDDLKLMAYLAGAKYTGYLCRSNTVLICKEPVGLKYEKAREWRIPCVNAQWLGDILLGHLEALRQVQFSRYTTFGLPDPFAPAPQLVLGLLDAWRVPIKVSSEMLMGARLPPKPKASEGPMVQPSKRARLEDIPPPTKKLSPELTPLVLFTGFEPPRVQQYIKKLYVLGGEVAQSVQKCTHLVASRVTRTVKFLTAVSVVRHIVTPDWLDECFKCQHFVDEQSFLLRDAEAEVLFSFSLEESLRRAHAAPLFKESRIKREEGRERERDRHLQPCFTTC
ncbi:PAX-interacting protein 1 isoform X2 [Erinaceus europaeus]|uniref:PAX-interacting protein 1 n=1 Tax=Erinaceus europaeus TaxID=9365 RepID=A0ABM3XVI7_ERIEU|nr:PAX-interacting protein 1 isoform X2 [Erinaceus europaeus]